MDCIKGFWTGYAYKGYVGIGVAGADANGYKEYENDHDYHVEMRENAKENGNGHCSIA